MSSTPLAWQVLNLSPTAPPPYQMSKEQAQKELSELQAHISKHGNYKLDVLLHLVRLKATVNQ